MRPGDALSGLPGGRGLNIAYEAVDRHAAGSTADSEALRFVRADGSTHSLSYAELAEQTNRFAGVLRSLGVGRGERVFSLTGRGPALYIAVLGTLKNASVVLPAVLRLRSRADPAAARAGLRPGAGHHPGAVPQEDRRAARAAPGAAPRPARRRRAAIPSHGTLDLAALMREAPPDGRDRGHPAGRHGPAALHERHHRHAQGRHPRARAPSSPTTSPARFALDLHPDDVFWCTADPGWVTGTSYGIIAPLSARRDEPSSTRRTSTPTAGTGSSPSEQVTVWYTAPTAFRMLMKAGADRAARTTSPRLRFIASVGEPLNPEAVVWGQEAFGQPVHDNWWQTETGGIMIANFAGTEIRPGSMGRPLPGVEAAIVARDADGKPVIRDGEAVLSRSPTPRASWPCGPAGPPCSAATCTKRSATAAASPAAGT